MSVPVSLVEAVTGVRVRLECALLTEAFMYQKMVCNRVRDRKKYEEHEDAFGNAQSKFKSWEGWMKILVTEICFLCIRRNFVDRMIELPWSSNEEKHLHKCLLEWSTAHPSSTIGSLLFVYYLQVISTFARYDFLRNHPIGINHLRNTRNQISYQEE